MTPIHRPPTLDGAPSTAQGDGGGPSADDAVARLVELTRDATQDAMPTHAHGLHRLERAVARGRNPPRAPSRLRWVLLPAALATAGGVYLLRQRAITFEVVSGRFSDGGYVSSGTADASVRFSDHSDLGLQPETRLRISDLEAHGARVMLEGGMLHVRIHPQPHGNWTLDAGPYIVHVTGTEFDLAWRVDEQTLDLRLQRGSVTVEGPLAEGGVKVGRGQHLVANANAGTLSLVDESNPTPSPGEAPAAVVPSLPAPAAALAPAPVAIPTAHPAPLPRKGVTPAMSTRSDEPSWGARVARGDFAGVLEDAARRGLDRTLAESSVADLAALADAARYARRTDVARRALIAQRARYPDSVQARDAPFFLGSLAQVERNAASELEWYDVYSRESPNGAYASEALGRKMMLMQRLRGGDAARPIATEYLARFDDGAYAPSARRLLQAQ